MFDIPGTDFAYFLDERRIALFSFIPRSPLGQTGMDKKGNDCIEGGNASVAVNPTRVPLIIDDQADQKNWHGGSCGPFASTLEEWFSSIYVEYIPDLSFPVFQAWVNSLTSSVLTTFGPSVL